MCNKHSLSSYPDIRCIIPPYMTEKLMEKAPAREVRYREIVNNHFKDDYFRNRRKYFANLERIDKTAKTVIGIGGLAKDVVEPKPDIEVYNAGKKETLPGKIARKSGDVDKPSKDNDVNNIYDYGEKTWDFYYSLFSRNSIDSQGMRLIFTVHYSKQYANAFWNGQQMVYGDGDKIFKTFTGDIDITGHELTHGVVQHEANFAYISQSGAINESYADVFGIMIKQKSLNQDVKASDWLIGDNVLEGDYAIRSLKAPGTAYVNHPDIGTDPQPATMQDYHKLAEYQDNGGVHINSGIPNHAFYLAATEIGGFAWEKAGRIWYEALCDRSLLNDQSDFAALQAATVATAEKLFGNGSLEAKAVIKCWKDVGL